MLLNFLGNQPVFQRLGTVRRGLLVMECHRAQVEQAAACLAHVADVVLVAL